MTRGLAPADVVVSGGGLAAAAIALELARRDLTVELLAGSGAGTPSGPGGPVAAQAGAEAAPEARVDLGLLSRHLWSEWVSALEEETGLPCEYDERGAMAVALDDAEEVALDRALDAQRARSAHLEVLDADEARGREPALAATLLTAFAFPRDGVARAGRVGRALVLAARAAGVRVREGTPLLSVSSSGGRVDGVSTAAGSFRADSVVLAGRAGPDRVAGAPRLGLARTPTAWLRLDASSDPDRPSRLLVSRGLLLVPRRDGTVLALARDGSPGAERGPSAGSVAALLAETRRMVPASGGWTLLAAGTSRESRPPDGLPILGEAGPGGLWVATGWGRDELLLAPAAAAVVADLVTGRTPPLAAGPFAADRSAARAGRDGIVPG